MTSFGLLRALVTAALLLAPALPAAANDGFAGLDAGGIVFEKTDAVRMVSEDLRISLDEITVDYVFRNDTPEDVSGRVAFPIPAFFPQIMAESDVNGRLLEGDAANPHGFTVTVDGQPVGFSTEARYYLGDWDNPAPPEREVTSRLMALGVPLTYRVTELEAWFEGLPADTRAALVAEGLFQEIMPGDMVPAFSVAMTHHWGQTFPAGAEVRISHRYAPIPSGSVPGLWDGAIADYCIDDSTRRGLERIYARLGQPDFNGMVVQYYLHYILTTANTWAGPIGSFTLTLDKGKPDAIISLCIDGITKTGPTTFVARKTDFTPDRDLKILVVRVD